MTRAHIAGLAVIAAAAIALAVPWPPAAVESAFSTGAYPAWQRVATTVTNALPFATFDVVLGLAIVVLVGLAIRAWRRSSGGRWQRAGAALLVVLSVGAIGYLWFLLAWGLNYQRVSVAVRVGLDRTRATPDRFADFAFDTVDQLNRLQPIAQARAWPAPAALVDELRPAFQAALPRLGLRDDVVAGRPKWSVLQPYFRWAGIDGVTNPFLPEVVVNHDLLPMEWPFTVAHEWGHLAGLAHEAEASYAAWLTCAGGTDQTRYSARLWAFGHLFAASPPERQLQLLSRLDAGPRSDLRAISRRTAQSVQVVRRVSWATYDRYLKSNGVSEGLSSYDAAIVLILAAMPESRHQMP
ncbi:MAG: DUF3810 family protein [Vicinamibacteraceae bacterium]